MKRLPTSLGVVTLVAYWCVHGDPDNLDSLRDKREQGNGGKATEQYIELLLEVAEKAPTEFGYEFGRWTAGRLSTYLLEQTGIKLSTKQISRILQKKSRRVTRLNVKFRRQRAASLHLGAESPGRILCPANPRSKI